MNLNEEELRTLVMCSMELETSKFRNGLATDKERKLFDHGVEHGRSILIKNIFSLLKSKKDLHVEPANNIES